MSILYTITAYPPSVGGAQLHLHEFARRVIAHESAGVIYHWREHRTDWLLGTTLNAPKIGGRADYNGVPGYQLNLTVEQRRALRLWILLYPALQGAVIDRISNALQTQFNEAINALFDQPVTLVHNSRIGREGLSFASWKYARNHKIPFVLTPNHHDHWRGWRYRYYLSLYREADALIAYSQFEREELMKFGVQPERIYVLGIGPVLAPSFDGSRFRAIYGIPEDVPLILFLGQKHGYKRFNMLLNAMPAIWQQHPETRFIFIGPRTPHSRRVFGSFCDRRVIELDTVDLQTKTDALAASTILCVPSSRESFGGVYVEAWTLGKPVIAGDAPAVRELVAEGMTGYTVGDDVRRLAEVALDLINHPARAAQMGQAGQAHARQYEWDIQAEQLRQIYASLR